MRTTITLDSELRKKLKVAAAKEDTTISQLILKLLQHYESCQQK